MKKEAKKRGPSGILASCRQSMRQVCSMDCLKERLPPLGWAPSYDLDMLIGDFIAGVTTALTVIPQGIGGSSFVRHCKFKTKNMQWKQFLYICRICSVSRPSPTIWALCKHHPWVHLLPIRHNKVNSQHIYFIDRSSAPHVVQWTIPSWSSSHVLWSFDEGKHYILSLFKGISVKKIVTISRKSQMKRLCETQMIRLSH